MDHAAHMVHLLWDYGIVAVAPWHTMCLRIPDTPKNRVLGLAVDCDMVRKFRRIVLTGHRLSAGMKDELSALPPGGDVLDLIGMKDIDIAARLERVRITNPEIFHDYIGTGDGNPKLPPRIPRGNSGPDSDITGGPQSEGAFLSGVNIGISIPGPLVP